MSPQLNDRNGYVDVLTTDMLRTRITGKERWCFQTVDIIVLVEFVECRSAGVCDVEAHVRHGSWCTSSAIKARRAASFYCRRRRTRNATQVVWRTDRARRPLTHGNVVCIDKQMHVGNVDEYWCTRATWQIQCCYIVKPTNRQLMPRSFCYLDSGVECFWLTSRYRRSREPIADVVIFSSSVYVSHVIITAIYTQGDVKHVGTVIAVRHLNGRVIERHWRWYDVDICNHIHNLASGIYACIFLQKYQRRIYLKIQRSLVCDSI